MKDLNWLKYKLFLEKRCPFIDRECWFCEPALKWLNKIKLNNYNVFEFGGGGSTLYFSDNCLSVDTIETSRCFRKKIRENLVRDNAIFVSCLSGKYDLILVDSSNDRLEEFELAKKHLKRNGFIIFDNINRYPELRNQMDLLFKGYAKDYAGITETGVYFNEN